MDIGIDFFKTGIEKFCNDFDENLRGYAWYDCNRSFDSKNILSVDEKAKQLFIYLANWGMVARGSFLMKHTWRILKRVVEILSDKKYKSLRNPEIIDIKDNIDLLFELKDKIDNELRPFHNDKEVSYTLISKILLGAFGCTVAYDRNVRIALSLTGLASQTFNKESILALCEFYKNNEEEFENLRKKVKERTAYECPPFKFLDLGLWSVSDIESDEADRA